MLNLIYLAHGSERVCREVAFCLLTVRHFAAALPSGARSVVYTDHPAFFAGLEVHCEPLSTGTLREWQGPHGYVHRVKLCVLLDASRRYDGDLLFLDSDTALVESPRRILDHLGPGRAVMERAEGRIDQKGSLRKYQKLVARTVFHTPDGSPLRIPPDTEMWNGGVIGVSASDIVAFSEALHLTDQMYQAMPNRTTEQFALGYVLQRRTDLTDAAGAVLHYWRRKDYLHRYLDVFWDTNRASDPATLAANAVSLAANLNVSKRLHRRQRWLAGLGATLTRWSQA